MTDRERDYPPEYGSRRKSRDGKESDRDYRYYEDQRDSSRGRRGRDRPERDRSRSRDRTDDGAPDGVDHRDFEEERRARMARLRAENEEEERLMAEPLGNGSAADIPEPTRDIIEVNPQELEGLDEEEQMNRLLGFTGFGSTSGEKVEDNQNSAARGAAAKNKARKYRQYMNRKNGFNRPLDKMD